jgi:hypothetical protein
MRLHVLVIPVSTSTDFSAGISAHPSALPPASLKEKLGYQPGCKLTEEKNRPKMHHILRYMDVIPASLPTEGAVRLHSHPRLSAAQLCGFTDKSKVCQWL